MVAQMEPRKRDIFNIFKPNAFTANAKQTKNPPKKNNVSKIFSAMSKLFSRAGQTDNSSASLPTPTPKNVEFFRTTGNCPQELAEYFQNLTVLHQGLKKYKTSFYHLSAVKRFHCPGRTRNCVKIFL